MSDSSHDNYPINEEPTRDFSSVDSDADADGFQLTTTVAAGVDVPEQIGDYSIQELIGSGGMGQVFLAEHTRMQRVVAIKMLPVHRMSDQEAVERFYEEVRAASRLMHPNIVTAFDAGESEGIHYLAMEYIDGQTLTRVVSKSGPLSVGESAAIIRQSAMGLLHAHRAGIVHRDVKPGNLMRSSDGTIKVLDLGLARMSTAAMLADGSSDDSEKAKKGKLVGTLAFMSPEQLEDPDTADTRSDIYSLGATLFFLLTARTPYTGDYLEQVYGHRHGQIPDLMEVREDVDMRFANIFSRMMAKSPDERYASLDEVIDDLTEYASTTDTPSWLSEFTYRQTGSDHSTVSGGSTSGATSRVLAIDFGMFYASTAEASPAGGIQLLSADGGDHVLFRMAVASEEDKLVFGNAAMKRRGEDGLNLVHCLPLYIGKPTVDRSIAGRQCPPEVLMAMILRRLRQNSWPEKTTPQATAITVPASYDQLHRQSMLQAASMAGLPSVRLVDRSLASVQSMIIDSDGISMDDAPSSLESADDETILFVGLTGQGTEVSVIRRDSSRLHQLSTAGHWHTGTLPWQQRLVDLTADAFIKEHKIDPRKTPKAAAGLQMACERAMNSMLLMQKVHVKLKFRGKIKSVQVARRHWLQACEDLAARLRKTIKQACRDAGATPNSIDTCVTLGPLLRIDTIKNAVFRGFEDCKMHSIDRTDVARGAAACLAAELPGRGDGSMPPRGITSQAIGILVNDVKGRRRILPIIPKGTALPARTNRRLTVGTDRDSMALSLVESSGVESDDWHSLGRYDFQVGDSISRTRMIGFELNVNGMLTVRAQAPGTPASTKLPALPEPALTEQAIVEWTQWLDELR